MSQFSDELRMHRRRKKLTQSEFASEIGVVCQTVKNWERPRNFPNIEHMQSIIKLFSYPTMLMHYWDTKR